MCAAPGPLKVPQLLMYIQSVVLLSLHHNLEFIVPSLVQAESPLNRVPLCFKKFT